MQSIKVRDLARGEYALDVEVEPKLVKAGVHLPLARLIQVAVKESGAFDVRERRTGEGAAASYRLSLALSSENYERFIGAYDQAQNERASPAPAEHAALNASWETDLLVDVSTTIPTYNQWSYQTIGSNLKAVLAMPDVDASCTTSDDPNEVFEIFGIEATSAYLVTELNRTTNMKRDIDVRHIGLVVDARWRGRSRTRSRATDSPTRAPRP